MLHKKTDSTDAKKLCSTTATDVLKKIAPHSDKTFVAALSSGLLFATNKFTPIIQTALTSGPDAAKATAITATNVAGGFFVAGGLASGILKHVQAYYDTSDFIKEMGKGIDRTWRSGTSAVLFVTSVALGFGAAYTSGSDDAVAAMALYAAGSLSFYGSGVAHEIEVANAKAMAKKVKSGTTDAQTLTEVTTAKPDSTVVAVDAKAADIKSVAADPKGDEKPVLSSSPLTLLAKPSAIVIADANANTAPSAEAIVANPKAG